ncbi:hypothetical protein E2C01_011254 [Portunus trituberculatus]|uniref:Uncharacterized protein n=1 Tax=Portunus trituberculatus TaxID=210409 RepID=A0A5B7DB72_PORTR|nr:hypothetical protein [Portunus trituberculatus]
MANGNKKWKKKVHWVATSLKDHWLETLTPFLDSWLLRPLGTGAADDASHLQHKTTLNKRMQHTRLST